MSTLAMRNRHPVRPRLGADYALGCYYAQVLKTYLPNIIKLKSEVKMWKCMDCDITYRCRSSLYSHFRRKHGGMTSSQKEVKCPCGCTFKTNWQRRRHNKKVKLWLQCRQSNLAFTKWDGPVLRCKMDTVDWSLHSSQDGNTGEEDIERLEREMRDLPDNGDEYSQVFKLPMILKRQQEVLEAGLRQDSNTTTNTQNGVHASMERYSARTTPKYDSLHAIAEIPRLFRHLVS